MNDLITSLHSVHCQRQSQEKRVDLILLVLCVIELFSLGVTAEGQQAIIGSNRGFRSNLMRWGMGLGPRFRLTQNFT